MRVELRVSSCSTDTSSGSGFGHCPFSLHATVLCKFGAKRLGFRYTSFFVPGLAGYHIARPVSAAFSQVSTMSRIAEVLLPAWFVLGNFRVRRGCRFQIVLLLLLLWSRGPAMRAQGVSTGALGGVVTDPSGAAVAGAAVTLASAADGAVRAVVSDRLGEFLFGELPPGTYRLRIAASGFDDLQVADQTVELGRTARIAPSLQIGTQAQTVQVRTESELPEFEAPVNANLSPEELQRLPVDGRRFQSLAPLTPLISAEDAAPDNDPEDSNGSREAGDAAPDTDAVRLSARGMDPQHNSYQLNGLSLTRAFDGEPRGGRLVPFSVAMEGVREFQVRAVGMGTSLGRDAGASVNTVTRRGEAGVHGSAFVLLRASGVAAANPFAVSTRYNGGVPLTQFVKPRDLRQQFGGSFGGPLVGGASRPQVFGFVAAEGQRRSFPAVSSPADPNFYNLSAIQTALLANRGVNTAATAKALTFLDGLTGRVDRRADELALLPRVDWQPGSRVSVSAEWARVRFRSPSGQRSAPVVDRGRASYGGITTHTDSALVHGAFALSPRWLGELRGQWSRDAAFAEVPPPLATEPQTGPAGAAPEVSIEGGFIFGNAATIGARRLPEEFRTEGAGQISYNGSAHTVTVGADISGIDERIGSRDASSGAYLYSSGTTNGRAGGLVDFITDYTYSATSYPNGGCPSIYAAIHLFCFQSFRQTFGTMPETRFHTVEESAFANDAWRVTPRLRLSAGIRYEYNRLPPPQRPNAALDAVLGAVANGFAASGSMPSDTNNLAPHAGIVYAPGTRTVLRMGYGYRFGRVPGRTIQAALENTAEPASQSRLRLTPRTVLDPACASAGTNFGYPATYTCSPFGAVAENAATVFARGFQAPAVQTGEISGTREMGRNTTVSASYVFALMRQLGNTTDLNVAPSTSRIAFQIVRNGGEPGARGGDIYNVPLYTARRSPAFGPVTALLSNGTGTFNALALQLERRTGRGLTSRVSWTYGKALDTIRSTGPVPNENAQFDPFDPLYDRSPSNFDRRHRVVAAAVWEPLRTEGPVRPLRVLVNGWSVSPVVLLTSGRPYSYRIVGGTALPGGRYSLNGSGGATYLPSVGRNTLRLPWTENVDLRVSRAFALREGSIRERWRMRLSAEAFNLFNHVNVTAVEQRAFIPGTAANGIMPLVFQDAATIASEGLTTRAFGTPTSSADSPARERRLQGGVRLEW